MKQHLLFILLLTGTTIRAQTENYKVYAVRFASSGHPWAIADWADKGPRNDSVSIDFMVWLIKGANGRNILVDAGFLNDIKDAEEFSIVHYTRPDTALQKLGLQPGDITDIILSHPHWDHIDGVSLFPNATVWMQQNDFVYFATIAWQPGGFAGGFNKRDVHKMIELNMTGKLKLVNGDDQEIIPGVKVFTGSRHTFESEYVLVNTGLKKIILASDNIWIYYNLDHLRPAASGGTFDTTAYVHSMIRMKTQASSPRYIIPGHDRKIFSLFPRIAEGVVKIE
jgi:glyoxylase-like metal-dependent hydrolase (beta-lactamase superfamily II)